MFKQSTLKRNYDEWEENNTPYVPDDIIVAAGEDKQADKVSNN